MPRAGRRDPTCLRSEAEPPWVGEEAGGAPERVQGELAKGVVSILGWLVLGAGGTRWRVGSPQTAMKGPARQSKDLPPDPERWGAERGPASGPGDECCWGGLWVGVEKGLLREGAPRGLVRTRS